MPSVTNICNMAINHIGTGKPIGNLSEGSVEARACNTFYEQSRDELLELFEWNFAAKIADAQLVEEDPTSEWAYSYLYPSDCVAFRRILSGVTVDHRQSVIPFRVMNINGAKVILTNQSEAEIEYTMRATDTALFTASFVRALSLLLASYIAPMLPHGDKLKLRELVLEMHSMALQEAATANGMEERSDPAPDAESIRERGTS